MSAAKEIALTRVLVRSGGGGQLLQQKIKVVVISGADKGKQVVMEGPGMIIGSHQRCELSLTDPAVSRQHAELRISPHGLVLEDLSSTNGTRVNGLQIGQVMLPDGAQIELGSTRVEVSMLAESTSLELAEETRFGQLRGRSTAMRALFTQLARVAATDLTVLLLGESGTGKELAARALHEHSPRKDGPFVVVDCGVLPRGLIESELFGHEKGAFTGAAFARQGAFEAAQGGTLFLDEIGELELEMQPQLLRAIESREVKRIGSNSRKNVDIRIVAGTNQPLQRQVAAGAFREDLFYRLAVVPILLPPLRERLEDIPLLVEHFFEALGLANQREISAEMLDRLARRPWPGNVRELRNVVEKALAMGWEDPARNMPHLEPVESVAEEGLPNLDQLCKLPYKAARGQLLEHFERQYLETLLSEQDGNLSQSARAAQINRVYLLRLLDKYDMRAKP